MGCTYFPAAMELRAGNNPDIEEAGEYLASYVEAPHTRSAADMPMAEGHPPGGEIVLEGASRALRGRRMAQLELMTLRKQAARGTLTGGRWNRLHTLTKSADLNDSAIHQITIVQFVQQMIGKINSLNLINRAFTRIPADNLRGKIPEGGAPGITIQVKRLQEPTITHTDFGQTEYRIRRNDMHLYISREDRMEATIDPLSFSSMQGNQLLMQARDLLALQALSNATDFTDVTFPAGAGQTIGSSTMNIVPRAAADSSGIFQEILLSHWNKWRKIFKYIVMHPNDYRVHETNYYSRNKQNPNPVSGWGITPFLGLEKWGTNAILSPWVPRNRAYFITDEGAYELDGPKVVDSEFDVRKFADYFPVRDFVGYLLVHPGRFTAKAVLNIEDVTTGDEITTHSQIQKLVELPENAVVKNDDA